MSGRWNHKFADQRGGVLLAVLAVLSTLAITITAVLLYGTWQKARCALMLDEVKASYLAESGVHEVLARLSSTIGARSFSERVQFDSISQVDVSVSPWGAYLKVKSQGSTKRLVRAYEARVGMRSPHVFDYAISQIGPPYPLVVSGSTRIVGDVALGPAGITAGEIAGRGFTGARYVEGNTVLVGDVLPDFDLSVLREFCDTLSARRDRVFATDLSLVVRSERDLERSESGGYRDLRTHADIDLQFNDGELDGGGTALFAGRTIFVRGEDTLRCLVLQADRIRLSNSIVLRDCIMVANCVVLENTVSFSGQIVVRDSLQIEQEAALKQLCLVVLTGRTQDNRNHGIVDLTSRAECEAIFAYGRDRNEAGETQLTGLLRVAPGTIVRGLVWWEGLVELNGSFRGSAAVGLFSHVESPTTYLNWLVDADVRYLAVSRDMTLPFMFAHEPQLSVKGLAVVEPMK